MGQCTRHACVIGQYASFARAVRGQLHLNGIIFLCISIDQNKQNCCFYSPNIKLDCYFFSDFVIGLINCEQDFLRSNSACNRTRD